MAQGNSKPAQARKNGARGGSKKHLKRQARKAAKLDKYLPVEVIQHAAVEAGALFEQFARDTELDTLPVFACPIEPLKQPTVDDYSPEVGLWCAQRYALGDKTLLQICASEPKFPPYAVILRWIHDRPEFGEWWRFACKARARVYIDLMIPAILANTETGGDPVRQSAVLRLAMMRIKYLESQARCLDPEGFGTVSVANEQPAMQVMIVSPERPKTIDEWVEQCKTLEAEVVE